MKILLVEDEVEKSEKIKALVLAELGNDEVEVTEAATVNDAVILLGAPRFDLIIADLVLPQIKGGEPIDATEQWCELIENHLSGRTAAWIVMTGFAEVLGSARQSFAQHNVAVICFDNTGTWESNLSQKLRDTYETRPLDFVIVCALEKERQGYTQADCLLGALSVVKGLDCREIKIGSFRGTIVTQPGPGMINAAIVTTKAVTTFRPRAVAMSGICGGRENETKLGALIAPDLSWNYQSGKFKDGRLVPDRLQVMIPPTVRAKLSQMTSDAHSASYRQGLMHSELSHAPIQIAPMVSGSQVVADPQISSSIGEQGRKVAGIDMEVASVYFSAHDFFDGGGIYFAAKTVVDLADINKDDRYHEYGCALSARFVVSALRALLETEARE